MKQIVLKTMILTSWFVTIKSVPWSITIALRCYSPIGATKNPRKKLPLKHMAEWPVANIMQQSYVENKQNIRIENEHNIDRFTQTNENNEYLPICESYYQQVSPSVYQCHQYQALGPTKDHMHMRKRFS